jgi:hypothetical protein
LEVVDFIACASIYAMNWLSIFAVEQPRRSQALPLMNSNVRIRSSVRTIASGRLSHDWSDRPAHI